MTRLFLLLICALLPLNARSVVEGIVVESVAKSPVPQAAIQIRYTKPLDGSNIISAATVTGPAALADDAGRFRIEVPSPSEFYIVVQKDGFVPLEQRDAQVIKFTEKGESKSGIVLTLNVECAIEGRIYDPELEKPVAGLPVNAYAATTAFPIRGRVTTDTEGHFRIGGLKPGRYVVWAGPERSAEVRAPTKEERKPAYPLLFFPGTPDKSAASMLDLLPGANLSLGDFRVARKTIPRVTGKIVRADGAPIQGVVPISYINKFSSGLGTLFRIAGKLENPSMFEFEPEEEGPFWLSAHIMGMTPATRLRGTLSLHMTDRDIDDALLVLYPGIAVTGTLASEGAKPGVEDPLWKDVQKDLRIDISSFGVGRIADEPPIIVDRRAGKWTTQGIYPGVSIVRVLGIPAGYVVTSVTYNGVEAPHERVPLNVGAFAHDVKITVARVSNSISGAIAKEGKPVSGALVLYIAEPLPDQYVDTKAPRVAQVDERGEYRISTLTPGWYRIAVAGSVDEVDTTVGRLSSSDCQRIEIGKTTNATLNFELK